LDERWSLTGAFAYTDAKVVENSEDPTTVGHQVGSVPRFKASLGVTYRQPSGITIVVRGSYVRAHFADDAHQNALDGHSVVDVLASYAINKTLSAYVSIQNLFNEQYVAANFNNFPSLGTPFQAFAGVRVRFF
jgi:outer membrane receptor protein involved in Fe transport